MTMRSTDFKARLDAAVEESNEALKTFKEGYQKKLSEHDGDLDECFDRIENLESKASSIGKTAETKESNEHRKLFDAWIRKPLDPRTKEALSNFEDHVPSLKALSVGSNADGGYAVPEELFRELGKLELKLSPVRDLVNVVTVNSSDFRALIDINGATSGWVGESSPPRTATDTPQLREIVPTHGEIYAYPQASNWSLDDVYFNVQDWLINRVAESFAIAEGAAVISGNGTNKPTGMLNSVPTAVADSPVSRAAAVYEAVLGGDNSPASVDADALIDVLYRLNAQYRSSATWVMNSSTAGQVRKLKDVGTGAYVWQPGLTQGQPDRLLGYPVAIWEALPDVAGGSYPIAFGDFKRGYMMTDRPGGTRVTVDPYTNVGFTKFYVRRRVGGIVAENSAIKWLKCL